jgi:hypothetical protein
MKVEFETKASTFALILSPLTTVLLILLYVIICYRLVYDLDAKINRAQVAADREDMIGYLTELKNNMERRGMTSGHFALIFRTDTNDLALHYRTVNRLLERLRSIEDIPKSETAYQVALDDIRGTIRELRNPAFGYAWTHYWFLWLVALGILLWPIIHAFRGDYEFLKA